MPHSEPPIISYAEFVALQKKENLVLIDASPKANYDDGHLESALHIDLDTELAAPTKNPSVGGRHPLPKVSQFIEVLNSKGINENTTVIIYDHASGANAAARFWWMLKAIGHKKVQVLNGGYQEAIRNEHTFTKKVPVANVSKYSFSVSNWMLPQVTIGEMDLAINATDTVIIDVRDAFRYNGESEPIDLVAGHIPSAVNIPYKGNLDENGLFYKPEILKEKYQEFIKDKNQKIVYCGSGVSACHSLLAMSYAGFEIPTLYVGSWSEWSRARL